MTDQHYYQIIVTKDDLYLELTSDDQDYVVAQLYRWFKIFLSAKYIPAPPLPKTKVSSKSKQVSQKAASAQPSVPAYPEQPMPPQGYYPYPPQYPHMIDPNTGQPVYPVYPYPYPPQQPYPMPPQGQQQPVYPYPYPPQQPLPIDSGTPGTGLPADEIAQALAMPQPLAAEDPSMQGLPEAGSYADSIDSEPDTSTQELFDAVMETATTSTPQAPIEEDHAFEAVMDSLMRDLEEGEPSPYDRPKAETSIASAPVVESTPSDELYLPGVENAMPSNDISDAMDDLWPAQNAMGSDLTRLALDEELSELQHSGVATATAEPTNGSIQSLSDICSHAHLSGPEDWLVLAAYYLSRYEGVKKFSLKRINGQMVKSGLTTVTHGVLESALARNHLVMVPDMTGTAETSEYTLSESGENYVQALLA